MRYIARYNTYNSISVFWYVCVLVYAVTYVCECACLCVCVCVYMCKYVRTCVCVYMHACLYIYIYKHTHIYVDVYYAFTDPQTYTQAVLYQDLCIVLFLKLSDKEGGCISDEAVTSCPISDGIFGDSTEQ